MTASAFNCDSSGSGTFTHILSLFQLETWGQTGRFRNKNRSTRPNDRSTLKFYHLLQNT